MRVAATETSSKVLIADDDVIVREFLREAVEHSGYEVVAVADGLEAWELIRTGQYRLVVSDWEMPGIDGPELCRRVRNANLTAYVYFVLVTGRRSSQDIVEGLSAGADDFLSKPINFPELQVRLKAGERVLALESRNIVIFSLAKLAES